MPSYLKCLLRFVIVGNICENSSSSVLFLSPNVEEDKKKIKKEILLRVEWRAVIYKHVISISVDDARFVLRFSFPKKMFSTMLSLSMKLIW